MSSYFDQIAEPLLMQSYATLFLVSFIICFVIILSSGYGFSRRAALDETAIQSAHKGFVPRVGGLAIYISLLTLIPLLNFGFIPLSVVFDLNADELTWLILSAAPVFSVGLSEDLGFDMSPKTRLIASASSSLLVIIIFKVWLSEVGVLGLDLLLIFSPFSILFTIFCTVGVVNAFNLVDGLNGLSSYVSISIAASLQSSLSQFDLQFAIFLALLSASVLGFAILNFPFGKIFLGDGGAYVLGHLLVEQQFCCLMFKLVHFYTFDIFWPVADTGLAMATLELNPADRPDRLHFHRLLCVSWDSFLWKMQRHMVNPLSTVILAPLISPQVLALYIGITKSYTFGCIRNGNAFVATYLSGISIARKTR